MGLSAYLYILVGFILFYFIFSHIIVRYVTGEF